MNIEEYERTGMARYEGLARIVANILSAAIATESALRPQQIQHRAKEPSSLMRKLDRDGATRDDPVEQFAKDLAGARVIFYTNSDVSRFHSSRILFDNFEVDWDRTKFHHPTSDSPAATELFESNNYVVRLKDDRAALPEYARYAGLWCEVQVQTTLNHAWAETAHDTIYKKPKLSGFGGRLMVGIEERMATIMREYLVPAGYEFQKVLSDFERLSRGQELFEQGMIAAIESAKNNNELYDVLERISNNVLPHHDNSAEIADSLIKSVVEATRRANEWQVVPIDTPFGDVAGKTSTSVNNLAASILSRLRFVSLEPVFSAVCDLYLAAKDASDGNIWVKLASQIAEPNLSAWRQAGPYVQDVIATQILSFPSARKSELHPLILAAIESALSPDVEGTTADASTITIHRGTVVPSSALREMRRKALDVLDEIGTLNAPDSAGGLMRAYSVAMRFPHAEGSVDPKLAELILQDSARIVLGYAERAREWPYELRQKLEHSLLWLYRHHGGKPEKSPPNSDTEKARDAMVSAIHRVRDVFDLDKNYVIYKVLVGFDSVFPPAWEDRNFNYREEQAYRLKQIEELIEHIHDGNAEEWHSIIRRCAATESNDLATFPIFNRFLEELSARRPHLVLGYLRAGDDRLKNFLAAILLGLARTDTWNLAQEVIDGWISDGKFLSDISFASGHVPAIGSETLSSVLQKATEQDDVIAVFNVIRSISMRDRDGSADDLKDVFLRAVSYMEATREPRWVNAWFASMEGSSLLRTLDGEEVSGILRSTIAMPQVDTHLEWFLADVAKEWPERVLEFFEARLFSNLDGDVGLRHGAIPFSMPTLGPVLAPHTKLIVDAVRKWYSRRPEFFSYHGGKFIEVVYPQFSEELAGELQGQIRTGIEDLRFVTEVARAYSGEAFLHPVLRDVVASTLDEDVLAGVSIALHPTGVTMGEFGRFERLKDVRAQVETWVEDDRERVQTFARHYLKRMDLEIAAERRRVDEEVALRRLEYGESSSGDDPGDTATI